MPYYGGQTRAVQPSMCSCNRYKREMLFVCPKCGSTDTTLRWNSELYCSQCENIYYGQTFPHLPNSGKWFNYLFQCRCGAKAAVATELK